MPPLDITNRESSEVGTRRNPTCKKRLLPSSQPQAEQISLLLSSSSHHQLPRRRVQFGEEVQVTQIPHLSDYSDEEVALLYNTPSDYTRFRQDVADTLYMIAHVPNAVDGIRYTSRGVEGRTRGVSKQRQRIKTEAWNAVFDEQTYQRAIEEPDSDWIGAVYHRAAVESLQEALELAQLDVIDVSRYQQEVSFDLFDDSWISSVSSQEEEPSYRNEHQIETLYVFASDEDNASVGINKAPVVDCSGFDDSWITDIAQSAPIVA